MRLLSLFLLSILCVNSLPVATSAQATDLERWERVKALGSRDVVIVERRGARKVAGYVISSDNDSLTLTTKNSKLKIERSAIRRVYRGVFRDPNKAKRRGALWGILAGLGLVAVRESLAPSEAQDTTSGILFVVGIGAGIGVAAKRAERPKKGELLYENLK